MPTRRFSTRSSRPTPWAPATRFRVSIIATGLSRLPSRVTGMPRSKPRVMSCGLRRRVERVHGELEHPLLRGVPDVLEVAALVGEVPEVAVAAEEVLLRLVDRHAVLPGVVEGVLAGADRPLPPRRDHLEVRGEGAVGDLEAHLVVALAGGAVGERVGLLLDGHLDLVVGEEWAREGGAEEVAVLVDGARGEGLVAVVADELLAEVLDDALAGAGPERLPLDRLVVVALAHVAAEGDDLGPAVVLLEPGDDDRGVEPARVGQHDLLDSTFALPIVVRSPSVES